MVSMMLLCLKTICTFKSVVNTFVHDWIRLGNWSTRFFVFGLVVTVVCLLHSTSCHKSYISWISIDRAIERTLDESKRYWLWSLAGVYGSRDHHHHHHLHFFFHTKKKPRRFIVVNTLGNIEKGKVGQRSLNARRKHSQKRSTHFFAQNDLSKPVCTTLWCINRTQSLSKD